MEIVVHTELKDRIGSIILNRPDKRNALNFEMVQQIKTALNTLLENADCKVIVLRANGSTFCSGADLESLKSLQTNTYEENLADSKHLCELFEMIYHAKKVVISMVNGNAFAGGCGLATVCDFCFASADARFSYTEARIGFIPAIVMVFLIRKIGEGAARRMLLSAEMMDANSALESGLINFVVDPIFLEKETYDFAAKLVAECSAQSLGSIKEMISKVQEMDIATALTYATEMNAKARAGEDCKRGIAAFLNKEKIQW